MVGETWIRREWWCLAVVGVETPSVLVGDLAPSPVGEWVVGNDPELVDGSYPAGRRGAEVRPVVAEVEGVDELLTELEARELHPDWAVSRQGLRPRGKAR
jgi:hypothetical protein